MSAHEKITDDVSAMALFDVKTSRTAIEIPESLDDEQYLKLGMRIHRVGQSGLWWMADWANYGVARAAEAPKQKGRRSPLLDFSEVVGMAHGTIRNLAYVAGTFDLSRRRDSLPFSHHAEVASLPVDEQEKWLDKAEAEHLSCPQMRKQIRESKALFKAEKTQGKAESIGEVERVLMEMDIFFEKNESEISNSKDYLWDIIRPAVERIATIWPERVSV